MYIYLQYNYFSHKNIFFYVSPKIEVQVSTRGIPFPLVTAVTELALYFGFLIFKEVVSLTVVVDDDDDNDNDDDNDDHDDDEWERSQSRFSL